ncbi:MAG: hypothetical protein H7X99_09280 [Saprospiraceae bacterium]|nr:hypothetical protein [Saprospiraceae bacterium]
MMNTCFKNVTLFTLVLISLISCSKEETTESAPADASIAKYLFDATKDEVDQQLNLQGSLNGFTDNHESGPRGGCATITITPQGISFPKTVTIVFPQNCTTFAGASIEGTVVITISGKIREIGTVATFSLADFHYKNYKLTGNYAITFLGNFSHSTSITNGEIVTPLNEVITYEATNTSTHTEGTSTTFKTNPLTFLQDDVYSVSSVSTGINSKGNAYTLNTTSPLIYKVACQWLTAGIISITEDSKPKITATLDYGQGTCDNKAILKVNNISTEIQLP